VKAAILVRDPPHYRKDAFESGLRGLGYTIGPELAKPGPTDLLLIWNRYGDGARMALHYERHGATVIVAENGYLGRDWRGQVWYQLALGWNNGAGSWPIGGPERAAMFADELKPWRNHDGHALVFAQRGIGSPPVAQPPGWHQRAADQLQRMGRTAVIRGHPGRHQENQSLYQQLDGAAFAVTWGSGAAIKALLYGVPVYHGLPQWIGAPAARPFGKSLAEPLRGDRSEFLTRLAWAQWSVEEIGSGYAFRHLLRGPQEAVQPGPLRSVG
jgi:hypothetical protein